MSGLLLRNATFIGFGPDYDKAMLDVLIDEQGFVAAVGRALEAPDAEAIDLRGQLLSPGWIDLHTHVYYGVSNIGLPPDAIGPRAGVTALVDAGSAGEANFVGFREYIVKSRPYPIYSFLNLGSIGLTYASQLSELDSLEKLNVDRMMACIADNRETIKGVKLRASGVILRGLGIEIVKVAKRAAAEAELPLMIHIGEPLPLLEDILPVLDEGDIVTHCYHGKRWGLFDNKGLIPQAADAWERGVRFDVGHGAASFDYEVAERAIALGRKPFSISTDLHARNVSGPVRSLALTMSKLLAVGLSLDEVVHSVTSRPAQVVELDPLTIVELDPLTVGLIGKQARFTAFSVASEPTPAVDSAGRTRMLDAIIRPERVVLGRTVVRCE
ncbi:amidohydrolase/deacetylase family metallohydrolase [Cohnella nanjingensis]|uniref:Amidohydrolase/deacetylase family metallohydrolase n=1 Tax=Cohnella nanjingensis TaxID=1387779 RepID=A0A7X0RTD7_9BACL|nr:amidohydrolase/deacetylase family metallohydrolase [Cohnella nanjingensis]MBB6672136.1 amidohydrolase/deacetylase family metallohydrolase [Cohnella nanjingensis]